MANPILKLGLPKGSLEDPTIDLFDRAGWKVRKHPRDANAKVGTTPVEAAVPKA